MNKNTLNGQANCKKTIKRHTHQSLCAKSRKPNDESQKSQFGQFFLTISRPSILKLKFFLKNSFHSS